MQLKIVFILSCIMFVISDKLTAQNLYQIKKTGVVNPLESIDSYNPVLQNIEAPKVDGRIKKMSLKEKLTRKFPRTQVEPHRSFAREAKDTLYNTHGFEGNPYQGSVPNDNSIAVSNSNYLLSVINSNIRGYDLNNNDSLIFSKTLHQFSLGLAFNSKFDPKVTFDPIHERFIMIYLNGSTPTTSKLVVAFSTTDNPSDPWNIYLIPGNPFHNNTWTDYPSMALSEDDLFMNINTFNDSPIDSLVQPKGSFIWQMDLNDGYNGADSVSTIHHTNVIYQGDSLFNACPIDGGSKPHKGSMYFLSSDRKSENGYDYYLVKIDGTAKSGNANLSVEKIQTDYGYTMPTEAVQPNGHTLAIRDARVFGGFHENGKIQFTHCTMDTVNGNIAVYHGIVHDLDEAPYVQGNIISDGFSDYGYSYIAYSGLRSDDDQAIIGFNITSSSFNAGLGAVKYLDNGDYSDVLIIKEGDDYVDVLPGTYERWGDYTKIQRKYDEPCTYWTVGTYGNLSKTNSTWIAKLNTKDTCIIPEPLDTLNFISDGLLYPNPSKDIVHVNFKMIYTNLIVIELFDSKGNLVDKLYEDRAKTGENVFSFSASSLNQGIYFVRFISEGKIINSHKFIKD